MAHLGWVYEEMNRYEDAESVFQDLFDNVRRIYGDEHFHTLKGDTVCYRKFLIPVFFPPGQRLAFNIIAAMYSFNNRRIKYHLYPLQCNFMTKTVGKDRT